MALRWILGGGAIDPAKQAVERFDAALDVEASKDANVITVSFRNRDPVVAAETVNTLIVLYPGAARGGFMSTRRPRWSRARSPG